MWIVMKMTPEELRVRRETGSKVRNLAVYWGIGVELPQGVTRLYVAIPPNWVQGYFEVHAQTNDTLIFWSETWHEIAPFRVKYLRDWKELTVEEIQKLI